MKILFCVREVYAGYVHSKTAVLFVLMILLASSAGILQAQSDEAEISALRRQLAETENELSQVKQDLATARALAFEYELVIEFATLAQNTMYTSMNDAWVDFSSETHVDWALYCYEQERKFLLLYFSEVDEIEPTSDQLKLYEDIGDAILAGKTDEVKGLMLEYCMDVVPVPTAEGSTLQKVTAAAEQAGADMAASLQKTCLDREGEQTVAYRLDSGTFTEDQILRYTEALENSDYGPIQAYCSDLVQRIATEYLARMANR